MRYVLLLLPVVALAAPVTNPQVTPDNVQQTICVPGWTKTVLRCVCAMLRMPSVPTG
jgi:hypothetical protein